MVASPSEASERISVIEYSLDIVQLVECVISYDDTEGFENYRQEMARNRLRIWNPELKTALLLLDLMGIVSGILIPGSYVTESAWWVAPTI
jgi:hypothetical protein